jgi:hypothetical protein
MIPNEAPCRGMTEVMRGALGFCALCRFLRSVSKMRMIGKNGVNDGAKIIKNEIRGEEASGRFLKKALQKLFIILIS